MTERLTGDALGRLSDAVCARDAELDADQRHAIRTLYALLAGRAPVTVQHLAAALGLEPARAAARLASLPDVERDAGGTITGFGGLTLRPTPHRIVVRGRTRYAWCAWDTLFLPVVLGTEARVTSRCGLTGRQVSLRVTPTGVRERDPGGVALSFVHPGWVDPARLRASFCDAVHFLADARPAGGNAPADGRLLLHLDDAFELGRRMVAQRCGRC